MQVAGREFSEGILDRIRRRVAEVPALTRSALSREVCDWLGWRGVDGRLKDMSCRAALLKLERDKVIELPLARETPFAAAAPAEKRQWLTLQVSLPELGRVWLTPVDATQADQSRLWWDMMREHHPAGRGPVVRGPAALPYRVRSRCTGRPGLQRCGLAPGAERRVDRLGR